MGVPNISNTPGEMSHNMVLLDIFLSLHTSRLLCPYSLRCHPKNSGRPWWERLGQGKCLVSLGFRQFFPASRLVWGQPLIFEGYQMVPGMSKTPGIISPLGKSCKLELNLPLYWVFSLTLHISPISSAFPHCHPKNSRQKAP